MRGCVRKTLSSAWRILSTLTAAPIGKKGPGKFGAALDGIEVFNAPA
jgi:hypothetical protein